MSEEAEREGFLSRWSRRKRAIATGEAPPEPEAPAPEQPPPQDQAAAAATEGEPDRPTRSAATAPELPEIDLASLPRIEDLAPGADLSAFLRPGVPAALRTAALRRMWSVDPAIRDFIGPVDYQWDFNTPGGLPFGFSSELGGEVKRLLAQAIGLEEDKPEMPDEAPAPESPETAEAAPAEPQPPEAPAEEDPDGPVISAPVSPEPGLAEPPRVVTAASSEASPSPAPRRRHGSALPS